MKIVVATAEPKANYHFTYFTSKQAKHLVHLVPDLSDIKGKSFVKPVTGLDNLEGANLVVMEGGDITEWTKTIGFLANDKGIPVVLSEMAYNSSKPAEFEIPKLEGISATSPYGSFNYHGYLKDDMVDIFITGHPMLDNAPAWTPKPKRILLLSSERSADNHHGLKLSIRELEKAGYVVDVRPHPREDVHVWDGFKMTSESNLLKDVASASVLIGVPGTGFAVGAALGVPIIAVKESAPKNVLPEYKYIFSYVKASEVSENVGFVKPLDMKTRSFVTGPVGGAGDRLLKFWNEAALTDDELVING